jgi:DNA replication protein DnaD
MLVMLDAAGLWFFPIPALSFLGTLYKRKELWLIQLNSLTNTTTATTTTTPTNAANNNGNNNNNNSGSNSNNNNAVTTTTSHPTKYVHTFARKLTPLQSIRSALCTPWLSST